MHSKSAPRKPHFSWLTSVGLLVCLASVLPMASFAAAPSLHHQFTGHLSMRMGLGSEAPQTEDYFFRVELRDKSWRITVSTNQAGLSNPRLPHTCCAYDGKYLYRLISLGVPDTVSKPKVGSVQTAQPVTETGFVEEEVVPDTFAGMRMLWLAFASRSYLVSMTNIARPMWAVLGQIEKTDLNYERVEAEYLEPSKAFLKRLQFVSDGTAPSYDFATRTASRVAFPAPFNQTWVRATYEVEKSGVHRDLAYPESFILRVYSPKPIAPTIQDVYAVYEFRGEVSEVDFLPEEDTKAGLLPEIAYQCMVLDLRLPLMAGVPVQYLTAKWRDPREKDIQEIQKAFSLQADVKRSFSFTFQAVMFCLLILPPIAWWYVKKTRIGSRMTSKKAEPHTK